MSSSYWGDCSIVSKGRFPKKLPIIPVCPPPKCLAKTFKVISNGILRFGLVVGQLLDRRSLLGSA